MLYFASSSSAHQQPEFDVWRREGMQCEYDVVLTGSVDSVGVLPACLSACLPSCQPVLLFYDHFSFILKVSVSF